MGIRPAQAISAIISGCIMLAACICIQAEARNEHGESADKAVSYVLPELPRAYVDTSFPSKTGSTIAVNSGDDLQSKINSANPGDEIVVQAGASFNGPITLPQKAGTGWIVIRTSDMAGLPGEGQRAQPSDSGSMPKILAPNSDNAVSAENNAHNYRLVGLEISAQPSASSMDSLVELGGSYPGQASDLPKNIVIDRCYIHGDTGKSIGNAIALNSAASAVIDSYISEIQSGGLSAGISCWNSPGPLKINNNHIEAAGINVYFGGDSPAVTNLVPSDIELRNNTVIKDLDWKSGGQQVENFLHLKNAARIVIDSNLMQNCWDGGDSFAIRFQVRNMGGAPWSRVCDVTFVNNVLRQLGSGINMHYDDDTSTSAKTERVLIKNNLFDNCNAAWAGAQGFPIHIYSGIPDLTIDHNTMNQTGTMVTCFDYPRYASSANALIKMDRFTYINNIAPHNEYGVFGAGSGTGTGALDDYCNNYTFQKNVLFTTPAGGGSAGQYPAGNYFPASIDDVGFVDHAKGNYRLSGSSPYHNDATDGKDIGFLYDEQYVVAEPGALMPALACTAAALVVFGFAGPRRTRRK